MVDKQRGLPDTKEITGSEARHCTAGVSSNANGRCRYVLSSVTMAPVPGKCLEGRHKSTFLRAARTVYGISQVDSDHKLAQVTALILQRGRGAAHAKLYAPVGQHGDLRVATVQGGLQRFTRTPQVINAYEF